MTRALMRAVGASLTSALVIGALTACGTAEPLPAGTPGPVDQAAAVEEVIASSAELQRLLLEIGGIDDAEDDIAGLTRRNDELLAEAVSAGRAADADEPTARSSAPVIAPAVAGTVAVESRLPARGGETPVSTLGAYLGMLQLPTVAREGLGAAADDRFELDDSATEGQDGGEITMQLRSRYADGRLVADSASRMSAAGESGSLLVSWETAIDVLACPAPDGTLSGSLTFDVQTTVKNGDTVRGGTLHVLVSLTAQVDDDAHVTSIVLDTEGTLNELTSGPEGSAGAYLDGGGTFTSDSYASGEDFRYSGDGGIRRASQKATSAQKELFLAALTDAAMGLGVIVVDDIERFFRGGTCIDVLVTPGREAYQEAGQSLDQRITARSTTDGQDVEGRASAQLADGGEKVSPSDQLAPTPAEVRYTGPSDPDGAGTVRYFFVSRRGIGTLRLDYRLAEAWVLDQSWDGVRYTATKCGGPEGEWTITRKGVPAGNGGSLAGKIVFDLDPLGLIGYLTETSTLSFGSDVMRATWTGMASFERVDEENALLELDYEAGTISYDGITVAADEILDPPVMQLRRGAAADCAATAS